MSANNLDYSYDGSDISRTLQPGNRSFDTVVMQQGKPLLDSEYNLLFDVLSGKMQDHFASQAQSGFLNADSFEFDASWVDKFKMTQDVSIVNGWRTDIIPFGDEFIQLSPASVGSGNHRWDFVFLEVWKTILVAGSTEHKPSASEIYKDGNVQNTTGNYTDDILDPVVTYETTRRVQVQYRIRIQEDVVAPTHQNINIFDASTFAQGGAAIPIDPYTYSNQGSSSGDYGIWKAGNGDPASRAQLLTVDGHVYAIPLALVFRRAIAPYIDEDTDGQQASATDIASGTSDRIDGLFYDSVAQTDVIDLRHQIILGSQVNFDKILEEAVQNLLTGENDVRRPSTIMYEALSNIPITGYSILNGNNVCDKTRSVWSDLQTIVLSNTIRIKVGDTDTGQDYYTDRAAGLWQIGDTITVKVPNGAPTGTLVLGTDDSNPATKPWVYRNNGATLIDVAGSWSGTGTVEATFTVDENLANEEFWIVYDVQYPNNQGLTHVPDQMLKLEYSNAAAFPDDVASYIPHAGVVRAGTNLLNNDLLVARNSKQLAFQHVSTFNNYAANYIVNKRNKQLQISPIISSTDGVDSSTKSMYVSNYDSSTKRLYLPFQTNKTWFVRGVYDAKAGGNELISETFLGENPAIISGDVFQHPSPNYSFAFILSIIYDPTGAAQELVVNSGGDYWPVFRQNSSGDQDLFVLVDSSGNVYNPPSANPADYLINHKSIPTNRVNAYTVNSPSPTDNWLEMRADVTTIIDGQELWVDIDFVGEPHDGAQIKIAYDYQPYQGLVENTGAELTAKLKALSGFVHSDGTGNVTANIDPVKYPRTLVSYLPTPIDLELELIGDSIAGAGTIGLFNTENLCYANAEILDFSNDNEQPLKLNDIVTAKFSGGLVAMERGGNDATTDKSLMLPDTVGADYRQAVIFGLAVAKTGIAVQDELVLLAWTFTDNVTENKFSAGDGLHIGVDMYFIKKRPLIKFD